MNKEEWLKQTLTISHARDNAGAMRLQREMAENIVPWRDGRERFPLTAGVDVSYRGERGVAAIAVFDWDSREITESVVCAGGAEFPYISGLLAFREIPLFYEAWSRLKKKPDLLMFDGQGLAHPRRMGLATHAGMMLGVPSVGCAKSRLYGEYDPPGEARLSRSVLRAHGENIGYVLRSKEKCKPLFVSVGYGLSPEESLDTVIHFLDKYRLPLTTRAAHFLAGGQTP